MILKVVSGGQTGADRGGLDAAIKCGVKHGGWCPKNRRSEDGVISSKYDLKEHGSWRYIDRTEQNVVDSDATAIFTYGPLTGGSEETRKFCVKHNKPFFHLDLLMSTESPLGDFLEFLDSIDKAIVLNVAGNRESKSPGIEKDTEEFIIQCLKRLKK